MALSVCQTIGERCPPCPAPPAVAGSRRLASSDDIAVSRLFLVLLISNSIRTVPTANGDLVGASPEHLLHVTAGAGVQSAGSPPGWWGHGTTGAEVKVPSRIINGTNVECC